MPILHMETEVVRNATYQMEGMINNLSQQAQTLEHSLSNLQTNWSSPSSDSFATELNQQLQMTRQLADDGLRLFQRLQAEVSEWEEVGKHFGNTSINLEPFLSDNNNNIGNFSNIFGGPAIWAGYTSGNSDGPTGHTQDFLIYGTKLDYAERYRSGEMSFDELLKNWADMEESTNPDYLETDWTLYQISKGEAEAGAAIWQHSTSGKYGDLDTSALSAEIKGSHNVKVGKDGLTVDLDAQAGAYLVRAEYDTELAGIDVAAEGYIGAQAEGEADFKINPMAGTAAASIGISGFAGGRVDGSVNKKFDMGGVEADLGARGSVSYGVGGKFEVEGGLDNGVFKADVDIGATIGLGGEVGFTVELDVQDAAENVVDAGKDALEWLF